MDLEFEDGSNIIPIEIGSDTQIGRRELGLGLGLGSNSPSSATDRTLSRSHLSLHPIDKFRVGFEVIGKNPIWVCRGAHGERRMYKRSEKGELTIGDKLSLSFKNPSFLVVKQRGDDDEEEEEIGSLDVSRIDPVKEFGFLVKGHEFDRYLKQRMPDIKRFNWFLEETGRGDDNNDDGRRIRKSKKKKDDDEWSGESEENMAVAVKGSSIKRRPKYATRSKDAKRPQKGDSKKDTKNHEDEVEDDEDEGDETLGGFIVDEEEVEEGKEEEEEESEEEFEDDDEELEDED